MSDRLLEKLRPWIDVLDHLNYYELLGVDREVTPLDLQKAFHGFSASFHPDVHRQQDREVREAAIKIFRRGAEAYGVLRRESSRAAYNIALAQGHLRHLPDATFRAIATPARDLFSHCESAGGRLHVRQFERALRDKDFNLARGLIEKVSLVEPENLQLHDHMRALLAALA